MSPLPSRDPNRWLSLLGLFVLVGLAFALRHDVGLTIDEMMHMRLASDVQPPSLRLSIGWGVALGVRPSKMLLVAYPALALCAPVHHAAISCRLEARGAAQHLPRSCLPVHGCAALVCDSTPRHRRGAAAGPARQPRRQLSRAGAELLSAPADRQLCNSVTIITSISSQPSA